MPEAVLIRALEPYYRIELMGNRRKINLTDGKKSNFKNLTNGPSKFCQTFDIKTSLNGIDLLLLNYISWQITNQKLIEKF